MIGPFVAGVGRTALAVLTVLQFSGTTAVAAEAGHRGFYVGLDLGAAVPQELESQRTNTGIPTNCDQWLAVATLPDGMAVPLPLDHSDCRPSALPRSPLRFDLDTGVLAGLSVGYALNGLRLEAEYLYRRHKGESLPLTVPGDPKQQEFVQRDEEVGALRGSHFFANLYYDFHGRISPTLTPYLGLGVGLMAMEIDYSATSVRTGDRQRMLDLGRNPNAAGLTSAADEVLSDTLFGYQLMAGLDYALSDRLSLGVKVRFGDVFGEFRDEGNPWKPLRGHESTVGPPGTPGGDLPVHYEVRADNLSLWGISLGIKYFWN